MSKVKFTGKSEEDAVRKAAEVLSLSPSDVKYKIVSRASGLLGMLGQTVTVEVSVGEPEPEAKPAPKPKPKSKPKPRSKPKAKATPKEASEPEAGSEPQAEEARNAKPEQKRSGEGKGQKRERSRGDRSRRKRRSRRGHEDAMETQVVDEEVFEQKLAQAQTVLADVVRIVGGEAEVKAVRKEAEISVTLSGQLPDWMGRGRGRVIEALQFLANKIVNRFPPRYRIVIDAEGEKEERVLKLEKMAKDLAQRVLETGEPVWILPMSAKDRRTVHMALAGMADLATKSRGDGSSRRLCIHKAGAEPVAEPPQPDLKPTEEPEDPPPPTRDPMSDEDPEDPPQPEFDPAAIIDDPPVI